MLQENGMPAFDSVCFDALGGSRGFAPNCNQGQTDVSVATNQAPPPVLTRQVKVNGYFVATLTLFALVPQAPHSHAKTPLRHLRRSLAGVSRHASLASCSYSCRHCTCEAATSDSAEQHECLPRLGQLETPLIVNVERPSPSRKT